MWNVTLTFTVKVMNVTLTFTVKFPECHLNIYCKITKCHLNTARVVKVSWKNAIERLTAATITDGDRNVTSITCFYTNTEFL